VVQMESQAFGSESTLQLQVKMRFVKTEHAQRAAALLESSKFDNPKVSVSTFLEASAIKLWLFASSVSFFFEI
jgi:hypothetical protein